MSRPTIKSLKSIFWNKLQEIKAAFHGPWLLLGDLNSITDQINKEGVGQLHHLVVVLVVLDGL